jgi:hypothetical protein
MLKKLLVTVKISLFYKADITGVTSVDNFIMRLVNVNVIPSTLIFKSLRDTADRATH